MDTSDILQNKSKDSFMREGEGAIHNPVPQGPAGVAHEMKKFKEGKLHSGSKKGPIVKNRKQAIAIALSESGMSKKK